MTLDLNSFAAGLNDLIQRNQRLINITTDDSINVKAFAAREALITQLSNIASVLPELLTLVKTNLDIAKKTHSIELSCMNQLLGTAQSSGTTWANVAARDKTSEQKLVHSHVYTGPIQSGSIQTTSVPSNIKFTDALSLPALRVPTFDYVKSDGRLYYIDCADHFAFRLNGHLLHGNIGIVYTEEKNPEKIKNCRFNNDCMKQDRCDYYHDPLKFPGCRDRRNFIASSWLYSPADSPFKNRSRSRRFGSRNNLDTDIVSLQPEEIARFNDQAMHDILCSLLLYHTSNDIRNGRSNDK